MPLKKRAAAVIGAAIFAIPIGVACDAEDVKDAKEGIDDVQKSVDESVDKVEKEIDEADTDGQDDN